ncbi:MAG: hypothetical protein AB1746_07455 [Candidatus Zixiibacteriota bacterium]
MRRSISALAALMITAVFGWLSCSSDDPVSTSDEYEITRFIVESLDGQELFTKKLIPTIPFTIYDGSRLYYKIDSSTRVIDITKSTSGENFYGYDNIAVAVGNVMDVFYGYAYKLSNEDTTAKYPLKYYISRNAYFAKLYDDTYSYRGWRFWGFSSAEMDPPGNISSEDGKNFSTDPPETLSVTPSWRYFEKNQIVALPAEDSVTFVCDTPAAIFSLKNNGEIGAYGTSLQSGKYKTGFHTPTSNLFYKLIMVDMPWELSVETTFIDDNPSLFTVDTSLNKSIIPIVPYKTAY